jgi:hypothetical protein
MSRLNLVALLPCAAQFFADVGGKRIKCLRLLRSYPAGLNDPTAAQPDAASESRGP